MSDPLRILSIGAGAIGTYIGGSLALGGHHVVFVERPEVAETLRSRGLKLHLSGKENHLPEPRIFDSIETALAADEFDVVLCALKSFDLPVFLASLNVPVADMPPFLCLSNGVENEIVLGKVLGPEKVIAGTVNSAVGVLGPGEITLKKLRGVGVAGGELSERLVAAMDAAGLKAKLFASADDMKWSKLLTNLLANATSAILDMSPSEIFQHPDSYRLEVRQLSETLQVMAAQGIKAVDIPGTPVRLLAFAVRYLPQAVYRSLLGRKVGEGRGGKMPSFHIDLHAGRGKSEVEYYNGAVVRAGERVKVPTPVNRLLTEKLLALTKGEIPLDHYKGQPERLIGELG